MRMSEFIDVSSYLFLETLVVPNVYIKYLFVTGREAGYNPHISLKVEIQIVIDLALAFGRGGEKSILFISGNSRYSC